MTQSRITIGDFEPNVIVEGARTPVGKFQGALKSFSGSRTWRNGNYRCFGAVGRKPK